MAAVGPLCGDVRAMLAALGPLAQAAAAGAAAGGGSRQVVAAAVAAAIRTGVEVLTETAPSPHIVDGDKVHDYEEKQVADLSGSDEVQKEVDARLGMVRPFLTRKVEQRNVTSGQKAYRNVALKDGLGAGVDTLPKTALEAKRRQRGGGAVCRPWIRPRASRRIARPLMR